MCFVEHISICFPIFSASPKDVLLKLQKTKEMKKAALQKLKICKRRVCRLTKKNSSIKQIVHDLKKKKLLSEDALTVLEESYSGMPLSLMRRAIENMKNGKRGKKQGRSKIPEEIRSFAMTLQFYSSKAYAYVRNTFNLALPAPPTIRGWLSNVECEPGFCQSAFNSLSVIVVENSKQNEKTICALMLDKMAIKKQIEVRGNQTRGYENLGADIADASSKYATEALVLMKLHEIDVIITSVTCDGPNAHFTMAEN
ncbi:hypothetical protein JTB14_014337 [Gonioctena quinquepunctata]|nr:hypothetical protein JTB14_014337 [Gonioctena quinquepunctata]